jgi:hypothetical protein
MTTDSHPSAGAERRRLAATVAGEAAWRDWGPYLAERAWGTVREDYSTDGDAWRSFPHDHARSRAYRWNEDGMAGFCDREQNWCLALGLWNGVDPIMKERMFGLTGPEGNHGEDVKEYWWYDDATPTHSFNTWRYHYPQAPYPYDDLVQTNARRSALDPEYELLDTGVFEDSRFWVVTVDYVKSTPHDLLMRITVENAGPVAARLHVVPTLWFRNTWSWGEETDSESQIVADGGDLVATSEKVGALRFHGEGEPRLLFCDNDTNTQRLYGQKNDSPYPKDGINDHIVSGADTVNPRNEGTKAAFDYIVDVEPGATAVINLRLTQQDPGAPAADLADEFDRIVELRRREADEFWASVGPATVPANERSILRQALSGLLWSKQFFHFDVTRWLRGDPNSPPPPAGRSGIRNPEWKHLDAKDVILMPDPWEYPWFAAWDLAFHCVTLAHIDPEFAKAQLLLILREWYMHPSGQIPAYEWNFSDVNPPTHAWAALRIFLIDGGRDREFLARVFHKLSMNFTWWTNAKRYSDGLYGGGFMGLDNIAPINRSTLPPEIGTLEQADSTSWMAMYALDLLDIALRLAEDDPTYEDVAITYAEHFLRIAASMDSSRMWNDDDHYFYDVLHLHDGTDVQLQVRSLVGLLPIAASVFFDQSGRKPMPDFTARLRDYMERTPEAASAVHRGVDGKHILVSLVPPERLTQILERAFDENELLSPHGIRGISAEHRERPFTISRNGVTATVDYEPAESTTAMFGGNSNWRGPVWFPLNVLLIEALWNYDAGTAGEILIEFPRGSGTRVRLRDASTQIAQRLISLFEGTAASPRPADARYKTLSADPRWREHLFFYEYFDGDTGQGLGASHQTGWTALVAHLILTTPEHRIR